MNRLPAAIRKVWSVMLQPFERYLWLVIAVYMSISGIDALRFITQVSYKYAICIFCANFLLSYAIAFVCSIIQNRVLRRIAISAVLALSICQLCVWMFCLITLNSRFGADIVAIILGTNASEADEFFQSFISTKLVCATVVGILCLVLLCKLLRNLKLGQRASAALFGLVVLSMFVTLHNHGVLADTIIMYFITDVPPDLRQCEPDFAVKVMDKHHQPQTIVLVIGESHRKQNNELYGYERSTNPNLSALQCSGNLLVFQDVTAPACNTIKCFQYMMSTYTIASVNSMKWYECATLPTAMHKAGYNTIWISNQSMKGYHDNVVSTYSELCDKRVFVGDKYSGVKHYDLDGLLLPIVKEVISSIKKQFIIVHLMGSHEQFDKRFPTMFSKFKDSDYQEYNKRQRQTRADYDNSVLYTDYVLSEIFKLFGSQDCIGIYLSDHGLDLYDTRDDYAGHGTAGIQASFEAATKIPFFIYMTDVYKERHPDMVDRIESAKDQPFRTDSLIYRLMDIASCRFADASK